VEATVSQRPTLERTIDPRYLAYQYGDSEKLRIRMEAHERYSERPETTGGGWQQMYVDRLRPQPGDRVLDVGCGFGNIQPALCAAGAQVIGFDFSPGMAREARQRALRDSLNVQVAQANAEQIPFADRSVDHALASHMLYHVPNIKRALEEIRRVVKVGGRVLITTNAVDHSAVIQTLHAQAARDVGLTPVTRSGFERFTLDELPLVQSVFPSARREVWPNAFIFPDAEVVLRYYFSGRIDAVEERQDDGSHRAPLLQRMSELLDEIMAREGVIRIPKDSGCFLATVEG
jgi:2-polyprenyl-3-methyl-5-hydroxy-6-metoxy-1,4-benzoquinol methylase